MLFIIFLKQFYFKTIFFFFPNRPFQTISTRWIYGQTWKKEKLFCFFASFFREGRDQDRSGDMSHQSIFLTYCWFISYFCIYKIIPALVRYLLYDFHYCVSTIHLLGKNIFLKISFVLVVRTLRSGYKPSLPPSPPPPQTQIFCVHF